MLNAKLKRHLVGPHALLHEVSAYIYIYIYYLMLICTCKPIRHDHHEFAHANIFFPFKKDALKFIIDHLIFLIVYSYNTH